MGSREDREEERGRGLPGARGEEGSLGTEGGGRGGRGGTGGEGGQAEVSPRFNRALIVAGVVVLAVITTLLLLIQEQIQTTRARVNQEAQLAELTERRQQELILELRAQARLNACLSLKLAKRHGIDTAGLDSPACQVFPNGAVVFPGEKATLLDPTGDGQGTPDNGGAKPDEGMKPSPAPESSLQPPPPGSPPGPEPPVPRPTPSCIDLPPPLDDVCLPIPNG